MRLIAALSLGLLAVAAGAQTWTFDSGAEGWRINDLIGGQDWKTSVNTYTVDWNTTGGNPGGFISAVDPSSNTFAFEAPVAQLGNYSSYLGGTLSFSLQSTASTWVSDNVVVFRGGTDDSVVVAEINPLPATTWTDYAIDLDSSNFRFNGKGGAAVSAEAFSKVMTNITAMYISAEYGASPPWETTGLDSVSFKVAIPEPSTTAALLGAAALLVVGVSRYRRKR